MLTSFAHPDREYQAREQLHKVKLHPNQAATDYVRHFNSLVQRAGQPPPSSTDQIMFFHAGLTQALQEKTSQNPATGRFWTDLELFQRFVITVHTHSFASHTHPRLSLGFTKSSGMKRPNRGSVIPPSINRTRVAAVSMQGSRGKSHGPSRGGWHDNRRDQGRDRAHTRADGAGSSNQHPRAQSGSPEATRRQKIANDKAIARLLARGEELKSEHEKRERSKKQRKN